jgi:hypothetical protein
MFTESRWTIYIDVSNIFSDFDQYPRYEEFGQKKIITLFPASKAKKLG